MATNKAISKNPVHTLAKPKIVVVRKREQCLILTFTHSKPRSSRPYSAAKPRGRSQVWEKVSSEQTLAKVAFKPAKNTVQIFLLKNILIPFCHRISWMMFIFPFQVRICNFSVRFEEQTHFLRLFSFFLNKILPSCR